jgi:hypothetical protein
LAAFVWVVVASMHPTSFEGSDNRTWVVVHIAQFLLAPLIALGVLGVVRGIEGAAASLAKTGVVLWAVWFAVYDAIAGVSTGLLAGQGSIEAAYSLTEAIVVEVLGVAGPILWLLTAASATLALRDVGAPKPALVAMLCSLLIGVHAGLPAAVGFAALGVAFWSAVSPGQTSTVDSPGQRAYRTPAIAAHAGEGVDTSSKRETKEN